MRSKFGVSVIALAAATLVLSEAQSFAGRRHGCSSCGSAGGCTVAAAPAQASAAPVESSAPAVAAAPKQPSANVAVMTTSNTRYRANGRRGFFRR